MAGEMHRPRKPARTGISRTACRLVALGALVALGCAHRASVEKDHGNEPGPSVDETTSGSDPSRPQARPEQPLSQGKAPRRSTPHPMPVRAEGQALLGVQLDWRSDTPRQFAGRFGAAPRVFAASAGFPLVGEDAERVDRAVVHIAEQEAGLLLTLEPHEGLHRVDAETSRELAQRIAGYNARGVPVWVRFGPEMNGSWHAWGQQPAEYRRAFRQIATAIQAKASKAMMLWAPNHAAGYPFPNGMFSAREGSPDFALLDTDGDGRLTASDDPYAPYYPGDDVVSWVGLALYHWGEEWPPTANALPAEGKLIAQITGAWEEVADDARSTRDFYARWSAQRGKPMVLETAAVAVPMWGGDDPREVKRAWWGQVFAPDLQQRFPLIGMVLWLEQHRHESLIDASVEWRISHDPALAAELRNALPSWLVVRPAR